MEEPRAQALLREVEYGAREPKALGVRWGVFALAVAWSLFQIWATWAGTLEELRLGPLHLAFGLLLAFLLYPSKRPRLEGLLALLGGLGVADLATGGGYRLLWVLVGLVALAWGFRFFPPRAPRDRIPWTDGVLALGGALGALYVAWNLIPIVEVQGGVPVPRDVWVGSLLLLALLLAATRTVGPALPLIGLALILYAATGPAGLLKWEPPEVLYLHNGYSWSQIIQQLYLTAEGIWGTPIRVSATFIFLFVLFGALLDRAGAGQYFVNLAYSALGSFRGGPAKAAVVGSLLTGVISGSSIANVVTTGTFTIPLMKRVGYPPEKAGATEVAASVNGQLMPPVMGAAAFIMADFLNIPYAQLIVYALVPALLAYIGLFYVVHLEALKLNLKGLPREELPPFWPTFLSGLHYLIPVAYLLYALILLRLTPERSALNAIFLLLGLILLQEAWRGWRGGRGFWWGLLKGGVEIARGLEAGARNMVPIAVATAAAGIVVGIVTMTNLGYGLTQIIEGLSGGNIPLVLILSALASLILGMGLPTTANYIVMAALVAPVIANLAAKAGLEIPLVAIHLFVFYFGILADDTPPVGLAAYAAAAIARTDPIRTGIQGFIYDMRTAILPFFFVFNPALLLIGVDHLGEALAVILPALLGMLAFVVGTQGYFLAPLSWPERLVALAASFLLIRPGLLTDTLGALLLLGLYLFQRYRRRRP